MKTLLALGLGALSLSLAPAHSAGAPRVLNRRPSAPVRTAAPSAAPVALEVVEIRSNRFGSLVTLRQDAAHLVNLRLTRGSHLLARDGRPMSAGQLRTGDRLAKRSTSVWVDTSQRVVSLNGVVAYGPDPRAGSLVVLVHAGGSIVADVTASTRFTDPTHETSSLTGIEDADLVQLKGVLDDQLTEMTQTDTVSRLGPLQCSKSASTGGCSHS